MTLSRAEYARGSLESAYDMSSCGIGVQRQLVRFMLHIPEEVRKRKYLAEALMAGTQSNLISGAQNFAEGTFLPDGLKVVKGSLRLLGERYGRLDARLWRSLGYESPFRESSDDPLSRSDATDLFKELARRGYISKVPSPRTIETFLNSGYGLEFDSALMKDGVDYDSKKVGRDMQELMLGDAKTDSVGFHEQKLSCMIEIAEKPLQSLTKATGETDYRPEDPRYSENWKRLFDEDMPLVSQLVSSAWQVVDEALEFTR